MAETYSLDGGKIVDLDSFYDEVSAEILPGVQWGRNRDACDDILRGGFGTPEDGFVLQWVSSAVSREALGPELFDELVEIVRDRGPGGEQSGSRIELRLE
jgi:RNAse (barnase) inhibitor barstar